MTCREAKLMVSRHIDGDLAPAQARKLSDHVDCCPACRELAAAWEEGSRKLRRAVSLEPATLQEIERRVLSRAVCSPAQPRPRGARLLAAAAAVLLAALGVSRITSGPGGNPEVAPGETEAAEPEAIVVLEQDRQGVGLVTDRDGRLVPVGFGRSKKIVRESAARPREGSPQVLLQLERRDEFVYPVTLWR